ncbi:MAG: hypothetical protein FWF46_09095 [Oscillospiraceae bacterium]|nr:hypothetical protein [Oscillospiraceae bacterium]
MQINILIYTYLVWIAMIVVVILAIMKTFSKTIINPNNPYYKHKKFINKHIHKLNFSIKVILVFGCVILMWLIIIPRAIDIPRVITGNYITATVTTVNFDHNQEGIMKARDMWVLTETGEKLVLKVYSKGYDEGEEYIINYLPYAKIGTIVDK